MSELTYIKVKTETGHYLKEFSQEYGMTEEEIRAFHNQHCEIHELLPNALAKHVEYVYLPSKNVSERKEKLIKSPDLILPGNVSEKKYGIMMKFPLTSLQMHYTVLVKRLPGGTVEFHKEKTWVNNQEIEKQIEQLAEKASQALYPLQTAQNNDGSFAGIKNGKEIISRWESDVRPKLDQYYKGEVAEKIIKKVDRSFQQLEKNSSFMQKNAFFNLYFQPVYRFYSGFSAKQKFSFYFPKADILADYDAEFTLDKEYTRSNKIAMRIEGEEAEDFFNRNRKKGKVDLLYKFHREKNEIFSVTGTISCYVRETEHITQFEMFELN